MLNEQNISGDGVSILLTQIQSQLASVAKQMAEDFYTTLGEWKEPASILAHLSVEEFAHIKQRQAQHLLDLLSPDLSREKLQLIASHAGTAHAMVGVDVLWLIQASHIYESQLWQFIDSLSFSASQCEQIHQVVRQRLHVDLETQVAIYREIESKISSAISEVNEQISSAQNLADLVRVAMRIVGDLPGNPTLNFARADAEGNILIEATHGREAELYHQAIEAGQVPKFSTNPDLPAGQGPMGRAWRTGQIIAADAWALDETISPWHSVGKNLGFRSSIAVPLLDSREDTIAMLNAYSKWPGYFSTPRMRGVLRHVQHVLEHGLQRFSHARVIPLSEQQAYRDLLRRASVVVMYQPIISLNSGELKKVECLARLQDTDGKLISPGNFLSAMGKQELFTLFTQVLDQALADTPKLCKVGVTPLIAINFPTEGLGDETYEQALLYILEKYRISGSCLQLEILETEDNSSHLDQHYAFIQRLRAEGIRFAQDDLGSGHSSLLRMDTYDFDEVKIDKGLILSATRRPQHALEFILRLTQLAHGRNMRVTVEGLETFEMLEAATILGANFGQGFGIGEPMPIDQLLAWNESYSFSIDPWNPQTRLGAQAAALLDSRPGYAEALI
jgi:EAL domain-containing protein (putative c-di-GMP-specific phosphodiesterase class I)